MASMRMAGVFKVEKRPSFSPLPPVKIKLLVDGGG
jgi:hypothetical protein